MKYLGLFALLGLLMFSCNHNRNLEEISLIDSSPIEVSLDTSIVSELIVPSDIYYVGGNVVIVNHSKKGNVFYCYDSNLNYVSAYCRYGNGPDEFNFVSGNVCACDDTTLCLYTDYFFSTEFRFSNDSIYIAKECKILDDIQNNVIVLNDSLVFYRMLQEKYPFGIYNMKTSRHENGFGDFPRSPINPKTTSDVDNVCLSNSVYHKGENLLYSFYESLPLVRVYDMNNCKMLKEICISDARQQIKSLDGYYEDEGVIYFLRPILVNKKIYVSFVNSSPNVGIPANMEIIEFDLSGNISSRYKLDKFCPIFTVSHSGVFYGVCESGDEYLLCKANLVS